MRACGVLLLASLGGCAAAPLRPATSPANARAPSLVIAATVDRDGDLIADDLDRCPDLPEDFDDHDDADGCPERDDPADEQVADDDAPAPPPGADPWGDATQLFTFAQGEARPSGEVSVPIERVLAAAQGEPLLLVGHSDRSESNDPGLSLVRAQVVAAMLASRGVDPSRLVAVGAGAWCTASWRPSRAVEVTSLRSGAMPGVCPEALAHLRAAGATR